MATKCSKCNADNPDTKSFCGDCGTQLGSPKDFPGHTKTLETPFPQFSPGTSLAGRYEVIKELGKGGMGEVYLAEDTNLKRQVAIKVLPKAFSLDKERLARFEREARLLASLNHPNIATIHGLEKSDGQQFLVMELVEGDTLAERIKKGPLAVEEALEVCRQIAEGLESAHEKGIIHRDLKPGNIKISQEGNVKILDFGLAKAFQEEPGAIDLSKSPTLIDQMTQPGVILGTAAYMSPEQAKGKPVDRKTDIWAFGCILYECFTGKRAFKGETISEMLVSILKDEPDWSLLPSKLYTTTRLLLRRCLRKDPRQRLQSIGDARIELTEDIDRDELVMETPPAQKNRLTPAWWIMTVISIAAIVGWLLLVSGIIGIDRELTLKGLTKFTIELPVEQQIFNKTDRPVFVISRDGRRLAWVGNGEESPLIYTRALDDPEVRALDGTQGLDPSLLAISPDGHWIAYQKGGKLLKIPVEGGGATPLVDTSDVGSRIIGFDWGEGDKVVAVISSVLYLFDLKGGPPVKLTELNTDNNDVLHYNPRFVPGGRAVIFANNIGNWNTYKLEAVSLETKERTELVDDAYSGFVTSSGHLLFGRDGTIFAVPFDSNRLEVIGPEIPVLSSILMQFLGRIPSFAVSPNGTMAYIPDGQGILLRRIIWIGRDGKREPLPESPDYYSRPELSPDGTQLVVGLMKGHYMKLNTYSFARRVFTPQTTNTESGSGVWSPNGDSLIFSSYASGPTNLYMISIKSSGKAEQLTTSSKQHFSWSWSKDSRFLVFTEWDDEEQHYDIWLLPLEEKGRKPIPFMNTEANESQPRFSPNGRWIAYMSQGADDPEIFVQEIRNDGSKTGSRHKVSRAGGWEPKWSPDGTELFFRSLDGSRLLAVDFNPNNFRIGGERIVLDNVGFPTMDAYGEFRFYDVAPDGQRFIVLLEDLGPESAKMMVVENWLEELRQKVTTGK